jgi:hypothetical protein
MRPDTFDPDSESSVRGMLAGWLYTWFASVERQAVRTLHPEHRADYQVEGYLFILAVRQGRPLRGRSGRRPPRSVPEGDHYKGVTCCDALH